MDTEQTRVKFVELDGEVLALFPDTAKQCNPGMIMSYQHIGQHGEASKSLMHKKPVWDERTIALWDELTGIGYNLKLTAVYKYKLIGRKND